MILRILFSLLSCASLHFSISQKEYFYPEIEGSFDQRVSTPEAFLGYPIGEFHTRHDRMVSYFEALATNSPRATYSVIGKTTEQRVQPLLTITSPENHKRLEQIRQTHLKISDPNQPMPDISNLPVIIHLGYNVHGNEPSSTETAILTAYLLSASQSEEIENYLKNAIIFIEPTLNPDGRDRHTQWANMFRGDPKIDNPLDQEHNEAWPRGRTNHFWFDLNRDWLPVSQLESQGRLQHYHKWMPNVVTDFHEMGTNSTYFFEPTKPYGSENPVVPRANYDELNPLFAKYFATALDKIGSFYYTKSSYDNSYPGYGSTYPDMQGGLGLLFEQASSRGHVQKTPMGEITFAFTIRNQLKSSIATLRASVENKERLQNYQREFFQSALKEASQDAVQQYIFDSRGDNGRMRDFLRLLQKHKVEAYRITRDITVNGYTYKKDDAYIVPTQQKQYRMVRTIFETVTEFYDSVFYDASSWTMAISYGMNYSGIAAKGLQGKLLTAKDLEVDVPQVARSNYAYLFEWNEYYAPKAAYYLLKNRVRLAAAHHPFSIETKLGNKSYGYGSILIPVTQPNVSSDELHELVQQASTLAQIPIQSTSTGMSLTGIDLGHGSFRAVSLPKALMLVGEGVSSYEAGEVWHLLETRFDMPIVKLNLSRFGRADLNDYTVLVMVSGTYNKLPQKEVDELKRWITKGGTLITLRGATEWAVKSKLVKEELYNGPKQEDEKKVQKPTRRLNYSTIREEIGSKVIGGSIYQADLDITHPLGFGYKDREIYVYRNSNILLNPSQSPFSTVVQYTETPLVGGYVKAENLKKLAGTASLVVSGLGKGRVILFVDNPNFRSAWYGTNKLFMNALFFGEHTTAPKL